MRKLIVKLANHLVWRFNNLRRKLDPSMLSRSGKDLDRCSRPVLIYHPERCDIGSRTLVVGMTVIYADGGIDIGSDVLHPRACNMQQFDRTRLTQKTTDRTA